MPNITIPHVKRASDNTGLQLRDGVYYVCWKEDGKPKILSSGCNYAVAARKIRDKHYGQLLAAGATVSKRKAPAEKVAGDPGSDKYIHARLPFVVRVKGHLVGEFRTRREAREARNTYLGITT